MLPCSREDISVSIHAPGRGATRARRGLSALDACFNSRTREGCDGWRQYQRSGCKLFQFTHPGGVRLFIHRSDLGGQTFQFTHPGGVRPTPRMLSCPTTRGFNSRTREGCDALGADCPRCHRGVSIHAPGRGATAYLRVHRGGLHGFNSRTREGCDLHPATVRSWEQGFNSRTREGCDDLPKSRHSNSSPVSIHAPGRGATRSAKDGCSTSLVSIHAPGRGAT